MIAALLGVVVGVFIVGNLFVVDELRQIKAILLSREDSDAS